MAPYMRLLLAVALTLASLAVGQAAAASCAILDARSAEQRAAINQYLCYYSARPGEPAHLADFPEALPDNLQWQAAEGHDLVFSHTDSVYWVRLNLHNSGPTQAMWYLELHYPLLDEISFWQHHRQAEFGLLGALADAPLLTGDTRAFLSRGIDYRYYLLPVTLNAGESRIVTLRIHSSGALNVPLALLTPGEVVAESNDLTLVHGLFYGALLILAVFNLLLFLSSGTRYYLHNAFYTLCMGLFLFAMGGFGNQYFWPESTRFANQSIPLTLALCALAMVLFGRSFLEVTAGTLSDKASNALAWSAAGFLVLSFFVPYTKTILLNTVLILTVIASLSVIGWVRWRQGYQPAFWYLTAWAVMVGGASLYALAAFGYLGDYQAREVMMQAAVGAQVILLNYAMVQRWRLLNQKLLDIEHQARTELEFKVQERTSQLRTTMRELEQANRKLATLSINDALTGLFNRRHMDNLLPELCRESRRTGQPLSLVLIDADHFKRVNDTWGHGFGDLCLRHLSGILGRHMKRPRDVAVRFGGEEFALLLPDTGPAGALRLCERILADARSARVTTPDEQELTLTLSAGIATLAPDEEPESLFRRADGVLYQAKAAGRDRILLADDRGAQALATSSMN
ncbi:MAG: sensor domain-containing diguanylate cyclase [Marinobacter sp. 34-60-7]|nr:MAG: sensor domain-containing diguanylate cyclase [Marinobacter sp. 34-60-7]